MTDITNMTDRVLDIFLRAAGGEDGIVVEHLTVTERRQLATAWGWGNAPWVAAWIAATPTGDRPDGDTFDYEGAILDQADERDGEYL